MKRVVILGATGFIGRALMEGLKKAGTPVVGFGSAELDLTDSACVEKLNQTVMEGDCLVFASAITPDRGKDLGVLIKNLKMAENVVKHLEVSRASRVYYLSSDAVYSDSETLIGKNSQLAPSTLYGLMHVAREQALRTVSQQRKIPLGIFRLCAVYGSQDTHASYGPNRFIRTALKEEKITLFGEGEEMRDHLFISDLIHLLIMGLENSFEGVVCLATGTAHSYMEVAKLVAVSAGALGKTVTIATGTRSGPVTHRHFDSTPLLENFPGTRFTPLEEGLSKMMSGV